MALVTFTLKDFQLDSLAARQPQVWFHPSAPATSNGYVLSATPVGPVPLEINGTGQVDLVPTTVMPQRDIHYTMRIQLLGQVEGEFTWVDFPDWKLYVPVAGGDFDDLISMPLNPTFLWVGTEPPPAGVASGTLWFNPATDDLKIWS